MKSIRVDLHIVDPGFEVDGTYRAERPGRMRIDALMRGKHVFTEAFDGQHGWEWVKATKRPRQTRRRLRFAME